MWKKLKSYFLTGLIVLTPLVLTLYIIWHLFLAIDGILHGIISSMLINLGFTDIERPLTGVGFISLVLLILTTGMIARNYIGKKIISIGEIIFTKVPLVNRIYVAIQQISKAFLSENREVFKKAVLIEFPHKGVYSIGFITQETRGEIQDRLNQKVVSVFLTTTPNPTTGFLLFVPKNEVIELDMPIEEALKLVISGGAITPSKKFKISSKLNSATANPISDVSADDKKE